MDLLKVGLTGEKSVCVERNITALQMGSGGLEVLATPALAALMEGAAFELVEPLLPGGSSTVGTKLVLDHLAATPLGMKVTARAELVKVEGRKLVFEVEAWDQREPVGKALHERFIINVDKFMDKVKAKN